MKKSINIVLIGVLTVASIILALPFTPLRNSFKGVTDNVADKALTTMGVDYKAKIKNARLISVAHQYETSNINSEFIVVNNEQAVNNGVSNKYESDNLDVTNPGFKKRSIFNTSNEINPTMGINSTFSATVKNPSNYVNNKIGGFVAVSTKLGNTTTSSSSSVLTTQANAKTTTTKQSANGDNNGSGGATHPGADPTFGASPSLPIGNGTYFLLALIGLFGIWKAKKVLV
ncbi:MAG: hypothetical protein WCK78_02675 [Paludibacter sp.]